MKLSEFDYFLNICMVSRDEANAYLDSLPNDLQTYLLDNYHTVALSRLNEGFMDKIFAEAVDDVFAYLYGDEFAELSHDDFLKLMQSRYNLENDIK